MSKVLVERDLTLQAGGGSRAAQGLLLLGSCLCFGLATIVYVLAFKTDYGRSFDSVTLGEPVRSEPTPPVREAARAVIDTVGAASLILVAGAAVAAALVRHRRELAVAAIVLFLTAGVTAEALKWVLRVWDVFGGDSRREEHGYFPSGHATIAMSVALALVLVAPPAWQLVAALCGGAYAAGVGVSLMIEGSHYASDVAGGFLLTGTWAGVVAAVVQSRATGGQPLPKRFGASAVVALFMVCTVIAAFAISAHAAAIDHKKPHDRFAGAAVAITVLALAVTSAFALLLQTAGRRSRVRTAIERER